MIEESLRHKDQCPLCGDGKVYKLKNPGVVILVTGSAPLTATVTELEKLRCNHCEKIFTAKTPENIGEKNTMKVQLALEFLFQVQPNGILFTT